MLSPTRVVYKLSALNNYIMFRNTFLFYVVSICNEVCLYAFSLRILNYAIVVHVLASAVTNKPFWNNSENYVDYLNIYIKFPNYNRKIIFLKH